MFEIVVSVATLIVVAMGVVLMALCLEDAIKGRERRKMMDEGADMFREAAKLALEKEREGVRIVEVVVDEED